jgi:hypothetical protein
MNNKTKRKNGKQLLLQLLYPAGRLPEKWEKLRI